MFIMQDFLKQHIRTVPNWPKPGIDFKDITPLLKEPDVIKQIIEDICAQYSKTPIDLVAGIEARGFIIGPLIAQALGKGFIPIRKAGKLPYKTKKVTYELEYGTASIEMHEDAVEQGQNILLVDDVLATGGTALAASKLIEESGGKVASCYFLITLSSLEGKEKIKKAGYDLYTSITY